MSRPVAVRCSCGTLFGYAESNGERIAIKHRDLFRIIRGSVEGPCRKCGSIVKWEATKDDGEAA
jgi:hypothetical protein